MENTFLSRQYLESVSTADLLSLADDYGIDIPDNLNRRFIIGELLEVAEEISSVNSSDYDVQISDTVPDSEALPRTFNATQIFAIMRTPAWAYVYWDIRDSEFKKLKKNYDFNGMTLRVSFYEEKDSETPVESFDVDIEESDREQYVLLPSSKVFFRVELCFMHDNGRRLSMAKSEIVEIPAENEILKNYQPGQKLRVSPLVKLSGMENLVKTQYRDHRQSFSS